MRRQAGEQLGERHVPAALFRGGNLGRGQQAFEAREAARGEGLRLAVAGRVVKGMGQHFGGAVLVAVGGPHGAQASQRGESGGEEIEAEREAQRRAIVRCCGGRLGRLVGLRQITQRGVGERFA